MERQYGILDEQGNQVGCVWATAVEPRDTPVNGFWFKRDSLVVATAWYGYRDLTAVPHVDVLNKEREVIT